MRILVKGDILASKYIASINNHIEYNISPFVKDVDENSYDVIITGNVNIEGISVLSKDVQIDVTGYITCLGL